MTVTPDPHAALADLEQRAHDGQLVDPAQMAQAVAAVDAANRISALVAQGEQSREAEKAAADLAQRQADAKSKGDEELSALKAAAEDRYRAALDAMIALAEADEEFVEAMRKHAQTFHQAQIPCSYWGTALNPGTDLPAVDGLDPQNYASFSSGMIVDYLVVDGTTYVPYNAENGMHNVHGKARTAYAVAKAARQ